MRQRAAFFAALFYHDVYFFLIGEFFIPSLHEHFHKRNRDNTTGPSDSLYTQHFVIEFTKNKQHKIFVFCIYIIFSFSSGPEMFTN